MGQIYTYENSAASATSAEGTSLVIETTYNGTAVKPLEVKLPQLKRNYIYSIQLKMGDEGYVPDPSDNPDPSKIKLTYNVKVVDWNNGQTFTVSEEELLKIFKKGAVSYAYNVQVTTTPDISSGVSADGGDVTVNATATKQKLVGGAIDPTTPAETITGGDKFSYTVTNGPVDWISISPTGIVTVSPNTTSAPRVATIAVSPKENPSTSGSINITQLGKPVPPKISHVYALTGVTPASLSFDVAGSSQKLSIAGTDTEMQNGTPSKTTPLTIADVTITKSAGADWLTVAADGTVTAAKNETAAARQAALTIAVTADPSQLKTVAVSQMGAPTKRYTSLSAYIYPVKFNRSGGSGKLTVRVTEETIVDGKVTSTRIIDAPPSLYSVYPSNSWVSVDSKTGVATIKSLTFQDDMDMLVGESRSCYITIRPIAAEHGLNAVSVSVTQYNLRELQ